MKLTSMKMKNIALAFTLLTSAFGAFAQESENLVDNGGFESVSGKPKKMGQIDLATGWYSPTGAPADLFLKNTKVPVIATPISLYGTEEPKEGENYAGIVAYSYQDKMARTYITMRLTTSLKKGMKYCVSFNVSLAEASKYACNQIGANLSKTDFGTDTKSSIIDKADVMNPTNKIFNAMFGWEKICGTFIAEGNEKFITIGNFEKNENTKNEPNKKAKDNKFTPIIAAYYFIDDVSVTLISDGGTCDCGVAIADPNKFSNTIYQKQVVVNEKMSPKQRIEAQSLFFAFGKDRFTPPATASLELIAAELKANPALTITVTGYCNEKEDSVATKKPVFANMDTKRAEAVKAFLVSKGIDAKRITTIGSSFKVENEAEIREDDDEDLKMAKNRRVTFIVK